MTASLSSLVRRAVLSINRRQAGIKAPAQKDSTATVLDMKKAAGTQKSIHLSLLICSFPLNKYKYFYSTELWQIN